MQGLRHSRLRGGFRYSIWRATLAGVLGATVLVDLQIQAPAAFATVVARSATRTRSRVKQPKLKEHILESMAPKEAVPKMDGVDVRRCRRLNEAPMKEAGPVIYWMSRDQRAEDNWALLYAQRLAQKQSAPVHVVFCLVPKFLDATIRQFDFMLKGLQEVEASLKKVGIPFHLKMGKASEAVPALCKKLGATAVVCDMSPLRVPKQWSQDVAKSCNGQKVPVIQVDAHNVVPVWVASDKQEVGARTIRKKIMTPLGTWLTEFPALKEHSHKPSKADWPKAVDWKAAEKSLQVDMSVGPVKDFTPGATAAKAKLQDFIKNRLGLFADSRNDPNVNALSGLSPWIHFGQISAQRCALAVKKAANGTGSSKALQKGCEAYIEESIVRRELSDNFCFYNEKYDQIEGAAGWAQETLKVHLKDKREHIYSEKELENGKTHDDLWNAAQLQMVKEGKMHGFLRMYWAKKILEWSPTPKDALARAIRFNDKYNLDGRDPNGYVGCMWSICGTHDMGWAERAIFGKIRFMNYEGCKRKFKIEPFVKRYPGASNERTASSEPKAKRQKKA
eukprot:TRINITY_DN7663_c2_g1_i1.p1 TRINITY_DN7663_c2_g1~~TRINITY_DN7663_c2_g1_i1.p1  ORF type:complete len:561 (+),score=122.84 TRINITY_DN7663_c2_g1_i1:28-1710(+)